MDEKNNKRDLNPDQRLHLYLYVVDRVTSIVMLIVKSVMWVLIALSMVLVAEALAGKNTSATLNLTLDTDANVYIELLSRINSAKYAWLLAIVGILYGLIERELRRRKTAYLQGRITKLEKILNPQRESSGLTPRGETNEEDKL